MANSKVIGRCAYCNHDYCQECSDAIEWQKYCSYGHEKLAEKEAQEKRDD